MFLHTFLNFFMRKSFWWGFFFPYTFLEPNIVIENHISLDTLHSNEARIIPLKCSNYKSKELKKYLMVLTINLRINSNTYKLLFTYINSKKFITNSYGVNGGCNIMILSALYQAHENKYIFKLIVDCATTFFFLTS